MDYGDKMPGLSGVMSVASACAGRYQGNTPKPHVIQLPSAVGPSFGPHDNVTTSGLEKQPGIRIAAKGTGENIVMDDKRVADCRVVGGRKV